MRIAIVQGHPDPRGGHFDHALADAYAKAAVAAGHEVRVLAVSGLELPLLKSAEDWDAPPAAGVRDAQELLAWARHVVVVFPLWLGDMPAVLKGFLEQVLRPGFAFGKPKGRGLPPKLLKGRSARIVVTMGMPALFYTLYYRAHSVKNLKRNILEFCGFSPVRTTLVGMVESGRGREKALAEMAARGRKGR